MKNGLKEMVSIIVPIYNVELFLERCVNSIINQTYKKLEILLIDDGSTDKSSTIADQLMESDDRIVVYHKKNGGLSDARNYGIDRCHGEYIAFIDSDDFIKEDFVEYLLSLCRENNCDIAQCNFIKTDGSHWEKFSEKEDIRIYNNIDMLYRLYGESYIRTVVVWNKLFKKTLFEEVRFPVGKIHEDEATTYKLLYKAKSTIVSNRILYNYVQNPNSIMHAEFSVKRLDVLEAINQRRMFFKDKNLEDLYYKDNYKLLVKILRFYSGIKHSHNFPSKNETILQMKESYKQLIEESKKANWSMKRRVAIRIFRVFPGLYVPIMNLKNRFERKR